MPVRAMPAFTANRRAAVAGPVLLAILLAGCAGSASPSASVSGSYAGGTLGFGFGSLWTTATEFGRLWSLEP